MQPPKTDTKLSVQYISQAILSRFTPIRYLTPEFLAMQLDNFKIGWIAMAALSWEAIENRDDVIKGVRAKRLKNVARLKRESLRLDASPEAEMDALALDEFYDNMSCVNALDENERGGFALLVRQMMDSAGKYYAVHEIVWQPGEVLTAELRFAPLWFFENRTGKLRFLPFVGSGEGQPLEEGGWMVTKGDGLMEACSVAWMFKHLPLKDWLVYSEKFGIPPVVGRTAGSPDSDAGKGMARAVATFGNEFASVIYGDDGSGKIEVLEVGKNSGSLPFPGLIERMDRAMCALWRGSDLSTMSADNKGASVQDGESDILLTDDAQIISETLNIYIDRWVIWQKYGRKPRAYSKLIVPEKENVDLDLKIDDLLLKAGARLGERERLEHYGRPVMAADDTALHNPATVTERVNDNTEGKPPQTEELPNALAKHVFQTQGWHWGLQYLFANAVASGDLDTETQAYISKAADLVIQSTERDLRPLTTRLRRVMEADDAHFANELGRLLDDRDAIAEQVFKNKDAAKAFSAALGTALVNGLTEKYQVGVFANTANENQDGHWVTIDGNHVYIKGEAEEEPGVYIKMQGKDGQISEKKSTGFTSMNPTLFKRVQESVEKHGVKAISYRVVEEKIPDVTKERWVVEKAHSDAEGIKERGGVSSYFRAKKQADEMEQKWRAKYPKEAGEYDKTLDAEKTMERARRSALIPKDHFTN